SCNNSTLGSTPGNIERRDAIVLIRGWNFPGKNLEFCWIVIHGTAARWYTGTISVLFSTGMRQRVRTMLYIFGEYALDTQRHTLQRAGQNIPVRRKVFQALTYLLVHHDRAVPKHELCEHVWPAQFISETTLESTIKAVRQAIGDSGRGQQRLQTLYGHGYRFIAAVQVHPDAPSGAVDEGKPAPPAPVSAPSQAPHDMPFILPMPGAAEDDDGHWTIPTTTEEGLPPRDTILPAEEHKPVTVLCCALAQPTDLATRVG